MTQSAVGRAMRQPRDRHACRHRGRTPHHRGPGAAHADAPAPRLSDLTGAQVWVKYENLQVTNSFKERGALVKLTTLSAAERARGVIAMSAGNHAQAVAYHARRLGIPATIVMPVTTPFVKVAATEAYGADVVLDGETVSDAQARPKQLRRNANWSGCIRMTTRM